MEYLVYCNMIDDLVKLIDCDTCRYKSSSLASFNCEYKKEDVEIDTDKVDTGDC